MSGDSTTSGWSAFDYADQEDGDQIADYTNISWRLKQDDKSRERKEKLRRELVRERFQQKSRRTAPPPSMLKKLFRR